MGEGSLGGLAPKPSGVETGGSGGSMNRWARAPSSSGPDWGHKNYKHVWNDTLAQYTARFSIAGEVIWEHKKQQNSWRLRDPTGGAYIAPMQARFQHFGLPASALWAEATEGPQVTVELGPTRAWLRHCPNPWSWIIFFKTESEHNTYYILWYIIISKFTTSSIRQVC